MIKKIREEWNAKVGVPMNEKPTLIHRDQAMLMFKLMYEELLEFKDAVQDNELTNFERLILVSDALADIQYLLIGTLNQYGLHDHFNDIMEEVHRSNTTKLEDGRLKKRDDGKILKPSTYSPPNIGSILKK